MIILFIRLLKKKNCTKTINLFWSAFFTIKAVILLLGIMTSVRFWNRWQTKKCFRATTNILVYVKIIQFICFFLSLFANSYLLDNVWNFGLLVLLVLLPLNDKSLVLLSFSRLQNKRKARQTKIENSQCPQLALVKVALEHPVASLRASCNPEYSSAVRGVTYFSQQQKLKAYRCHSSAGTVKTVCQITLL